MSGQIKKQKLLLLGFGDIARRLAARLVEDYEITGVRRRAEQYSGVSLVQGDCRDASFMQQITHVHYDVMVITMTPGEMGDEAYRRAYVETTQVLLNSLQANRVKPGLIVFVSSSSVYGQSNNEWVDEASETLPASYSGKRLLEAENLLLQSAYPSCIVRFSGIYGLGRQRLIEQVMAGNGAEQSPVLYSNRIHSDDCAGVLQHIIGQHKAGRPIEPIYLATDCEPSPLYEVKKWLAQQLDIEQLHPKPLGGRGLRSGKRCSNKKLLGSGYEFLYPTFKEGYKMVLDTIGVKAKQ